MLYHATRQRFINSIKREGLHATNRKSFEGQIGENLVYFSTDKDCAASYVECADNIPESWYDDNIIVLAVNEMNLDKRYFCKDPNIVGEESTIAYRKCVPPSIIGIVDFKNKKIIHLSNIKRLSDRFYY